MNFQDYKSKCIERWHGEPLGDALRNWEDWEEQREYLYEAMRQYLRNPFQQDLGGKCHNSSGNLKEYLWNCQAALQPNKSRLDPFLDFEEYYQTIFLRRGLVIYCGMILDELKNENTKPTIFDGELIHQYPKEV